MKKNNLYERNLLTCINKSGKNEQFLRNGSILLNKFFLHGIYLKYIEVPVTTKCTLNCKECCNLIQYYQNPYHIEAGDIIRDIRKLSKIAKEILQLRLLGGEPLLHPELALIVKQTLKLKNIKEIQIVTNGSLLLDKNMLKILRNNHRVSIDISNYKEKSVKKEKLIEQLKLNNIKYYTQEEGIVWTAQANFTYRNRNQEQLKNVLEKCNMDCISMLNGRIHLCPRSSHGMDLGIVPNIRSDYCNLRENSVRECKKNLYKLLNKKSIAACNYCDIFRWEKLPKVIAAEQISKKDAKVVLDNFWRETKENHKQGNYGKNRAGKEERKDFGYDNQK